MTFKPIAILLMEILPYWSVKNQTPSDWFYWFKFILYFLDFSCASLAFDTYDQAVSLVTLLTCQKWLNCFVLLWRSSNFSPLQFPYYLLRFSVQNAFFGKTVILYILWKKYAHGSFFLTSSRCSFIFFLSNSLFVCQRHFCLFHEVLFDYTRLTDLLSSVTFLPSLQNESVKWLITFSFIYKHYINLVSSVCT